MIGMATLAGGLIIGLTGGIAAPLVGGALAGLGVSFFATTAGLAIITSVFGVAGAGLTGWRARRGGDRPPPRMRSVVLIFPLARLARPRTEDPTGYKMAKRVKGVDDFEFTLIRGGERMNVTIGVSGWLSREDDLCGFRHLGARLHRVRFLTALPRARQTVGPRPWPQQRTPLAVL